LIIEAPQQPRFWSGPTWVTRAMLDVSPLRTDTTAGTQSGIALMLLQSSVYSAKSVTAPSSGVAPPEHAAAVEETDTFTFMDEHTVWEK
jgi:hypothetical protein